VDCLVQCSVLSDVMTMQPLQLAFEKFGDSQNTPLIILHGFFASSRNWRSIARILSARHCVYVVDMRNHGRSPQTKIMDYPSMTSDLQYFLEQQEITQANLLGHSMGGKTAMWFTLNYPDSVEKLIVADISPSRYQHSFNKTIQALKDLPLCSIRNRKEADVVLAKSIEDNNYRQFLLQNLQLKNGEYSWRVDLDTFYQSADNIIAFPDADGLMPYLGDALFLKGENSDYIKADDVFSLFPNALIQSIPDTAHWLHVQAPERFCHEVNVFLG